MSNKGSGASMLMLGAFAGALGAVAVLAAKVNKSVVDDEISSGLISDPDAKGSRFQNIQAEFSKVRKESAKLLNDMKHESRNLIRSRKVSPPSMTVTGTGSVMAHPDRFRVFCSVMTESSVKGEAVASHDKALEKVSEFLLEDLKLGDNSCTIRNSSVTERNRSPKAKEPDIVYQCVTDFTVTVDDESVLQKLLVCANDISLCNVYVRSEVKDVEMYRRAAYKFALDNALLKGAEMLRDYDQDIIGIREISETCAAPAMYRGMHSDDSVRTVGTVTTRDQTIKNLSQMSVEDVTVTATLDVTLDLSESTK